MNKKELLEALTERFVAGFKGVNVTNGDVIKTLFPNSEIIFVLGNIPKTDVIKIKNEAFLVEKSWWNAPYKAESEVIGNANGNN